MYVELAFETGRTIEEVKTVSDFFWAEVRENLSNLANVRIHLTGLGDFVIKHWLIDKEVQRCQQIMQNRASLSEPLQKRIDKLIKARDMHLEEVQRKDFIYNHKKLSNENKPRKSDSDLEE
jgi:Zn-dependent M16 (insulinase) family peptidase